MTDTCVAEAMIVEMLDALETEVGALRSIASLRVPRGYAPADPSALEAGLERASLTAAEFARIAEVSREDVEDWLGNRAPMPAWVLTALRLAVLLTPSTRRKVLRRPLGPAIIPIQKVHPFSRIEDL